MIAGDLNADPMDGDSVPGAARQLTEHPLVNASVTPASEGGAAAAATQGGANAGQRGDPRFDTADFGDEVAGNLRVDYVLPSVGLKVAGAGVFWPVEGEPGAALIDASDHRLVWVDVILPSASASASPGPTPATPPPSSAGPASSTLTVRSD